MKSLLFRRSTLAAVFVASSCLIAPLTVSPIQAAPTAAPGVPSDDVLDASTASVIAQLAANGSVSVETKKQVESASQSLAETESLLPKVRQQIEQASVDAAKAQESYAVKQAEAVQANSEVSRREENLAVAKKNADSAKNMVGAVARDMYMQGVGSTSEMNIVLSAKSPADAVVRAEGARIISDTANTSMVQQSSQADAVAVAVDEVKKAQQVAAQAEGEATAQKALADDRAAAAAEGERQISTLAQEKTKIVTALQTALISAQASANDLQSQLATLQGLKAANSQWAAATAAAAAAAAASAAVASSVPVAPGTTVTAPETVATGCPQTELKAVCEDAYFRAGSPTAAKAILYAFANIGAPYSQGNRLGVNPNVYDCSSFVARAYDAAGATIRKSGQVGNWLGTFSFTGMYTPGAYAGTNVTRVNTLAEMKPGDVIIEFNGTDPSMSAGNNGHAQMYLGNNMVIQSGGGGDSTVNVAQHHNSFSNEWYFHYSE